MTTKTFCTVNSHSITLFPSCTVHITTVMQIHQKMQEKKIIPLGHSMCKHNHLSHTVHVLSFSSVNVQIYRTLPTPPDDQSSSQRPVWSAISVSELRLSSAM